MANKSKQIELFELRKPMSLKWRVQRANDKANPTKVYMVAYVDARDVQNRFDDVLGAGNWQTRYFECRNKQFCEIGVKVGDEWVWKGDSGVETATEKEKGETSDAFKRAAVHWGVNRNAYKTQIVELPCKAFNGKPYPTTKDGRFLKGKELNKVCDELANVQDQELVFEAELHERNRYKFDKVQND